MDEAGIRMATVRLEDIRVNAMQAYQYAEQCVLRVLHGADTVGLSNETIVSQYAELMAQMGKRITVQSDALVKDLEVYRDRSRA
jgi:hypothetical protein